MTLITLEKVARSFGDHLVFEDISLRIDAGDRLGVIGDNGCGKTTLIGVLAGRDEPDRGQRHVQRGLRVAYGAQIPRLPAGTTVLESVLQGDGTFTELTEQVRALEAALAETPADERLLQEYGHLQTVFEAGGGYHRRHLCEKVLSGIGFSEADHQKDVSHLSGGEKSRLQLCGLMVAPADLLILDEPTNHLDLDGIEFLESYLRRSVSACVVVSHDRRFLDNVATAVLEIESGGAQRYPGNYTAFRRQRDEQLLAEARAHKSQQRMIEKEMDYIRRNMAGRMSVQAKGRLKRLQRIERLQRPGTPSSGMALSFRGGRGLAGQSVLEVEGLGHTLPNGRELLRNVEFRLVYGETLGILGRNGAGKTTLLHLLAGRMPLQKGVIHRAQRVQPGYFSQEMSDLPSGGTVLEALRALDMTVPDKELRDHLALFLFRGDEVDKPVETLSGGEKRRLCLARLTRGQYDYLCLDEPTNHLDITAREGLEDALRTYPGAAVLISHDREFLEAVADRVLWVEDGAVTVYDGGLEQCVARRAEARSAASALTKKTDRRRTEPTPDSSSDPSGKVRNPILFQKLEDRIMGLEEELATLRDAMTQSDNYLDAGKMRDLQAREAETQRELEAAYEKWENW